MTDLTMGQRIAEERKKLGISQEALGEKMGVSRQAISKWESDGAVPEIDKLITLSKLFGVSVGWLLGVEDLPTPIEENREDTLSEKQLQIVEELVKKYQSKQIKHTLQLQWISIFALLLILLASIYKFSVRVDSSQGNYGALTSQLNELRSQVQMIKTNAEAPTTLSLFGEYSFELEQLTDAPGAQIHFAAMPNVWQEGDSGYLTITRDGMEPLRIDCSWNGAWFTADFPLGAADGYEFCMVIRHSDGTQEQQILHDETAEELAQSLSVSDKVDFGNASYVNSAFTLFNCNINVTMPEVGFVYGEQTWENIDLLLYQSGEEVGRFNLLEAYPDGTEKDEDILKSYSLTMCYGSIRFDGVQLAQNEEIVLYISAQLSNGLSTQARVGNWVIDANGELIDL